MALHTKLRFWLNTASALGTLVVAPETSHPASDFRANGTRPAWHHVKYDEYTGDLEGLGITNRLRFPDPIDSTPRTSRKNRSTWLAGQDQCVPLVALLPRRMD